MTTRGLIIKSAQVSYELTACRALNILFSESKWFSVLLLICLTVTAIWRCFVGNCMCTNEYQMGNRKQFWCLYGNKIVNRYDLNEVLDIRGENKDNGAELCAWSYKGGDNQHWHFEYV